MHGRFPFQYFGFFGQVIVLQVDHREPVIETVRDILRREILKITRPVVDTAAPTDSNPDSIMGEVLEVGPPMGPAIRVGLKISCGPDDRAGGSGPDLVNMFADLEPEMFWNMTRWGFERDFRSSCLFVNRMRACDIVEIRKGSSEEIDQTVVAFDE